MSIASEPAVPTVSDPREGAGAAGVTELAKIERMSHELSRRGGLSEAETAAELTRLLAIPGASLYLQIAASAWGATLTLRPADRATLCVRNAFCCGAGHPASLPSDRGHVMILYCQSAKHTQFEGTVPADLQHMVLVVNGRLVTLATRDLPLELDLDTA